MILEITPRAAKVPPPPSPTLGSPPPSSRQN
jgi:hypothetical protein